MTLSVTGSASASFKTWRILEDDLPSKSFEYLAVSIEKKDVRQLKTWRQEGKEFEVMTAKIARSIVEVN